MGLMTLVGAVNRQRKQQKSSGSKRKKRIMNTLEGSRVGRAILFTGRAIDSTMRVASLGIDAGMRFALGVMGNLTSWLTQTSDYSKNGIYPKAELKGKKVKIKIIPMCVEKTVVSHQPQLKPSTCQTLIQHLVHW